MPRWWHDLRSFWWTPELAAAFSGSSGAPPRSFRNDLRATRATALAAVRENSGIAGHGDRRLDWLSHSRWDMSNEDAAGNRPMWRAWESQALADLAESARRKQGPAQPFDTAIELVRSALRATSACIFLRDAASGDFLCTDWLPPQRRSQAPVQPLRLREDAFTIRRLRRLGVPVTVDPADFAAWEHGLETSLPAHLDRRREEIETLQIARARLLVPLTIREEFRGLLVLGPREDRTDYTSQHREIAAELATQFASLLDYSQAPRR